MTTRMLALTFALSAVVAAALLGFFDQVAVRRDLPAIVMPTAEPFVVEAAALPQTVGAAAPDAADQRLLSRGQASPAQPAASSSPTS